VFIKVKSDAPSLGERFFSSVTLKYGLSAMATHRTWYAVPRVVPANAAAEDMAKVRPMFHGGVRINRP